MMGRLSHDQEQFFYSFRLDEAVPEDHAVREIAAVLDLSWAHSELAPYYPEIGRPSIDPVLMIRMLIVGYVFGIRSERALCREVQVNLAYRWFCGLSIEDKVPDHSAFSRARNERFGDSNVFRCVFERIVGTCIAAGLVGGEGFAVDASLIQADANKHRSIRGAEWHKDIDPEQAFRAVKEYLAHTDHALRYLGSGPECRACPLKAKCCPNMPARRIVRDVNEAARDVARALAKTQAFAQSRRSRKKVEMLFAHLKRILRLSRLRLRGPSGAQFEFTLAAIAQNLRRLAKLVARPPPITSAACVA